MKKEFWKKLLSVIAMTSICSCVFAVNGVDIELGQDNGGTLKTVSAATAPFTPTDY